MKKWKDTLKYIVFEITGDFYIREFEPSKVVDSQLITSKKDIQDKVPFKQRECKELTNIKTSWKKPLWHKEK